MKSSSHYLRKTARRFLNTRDESSNVPLPDNAKERWKQALRALIESCSRRLGRGGAPLRVGALAFRARSLPHAVYNTAGVTAQHTPQLQNAMRGHLV